MKFWKVLKVCLVLTALFPNFAFSQNETPTEVKKELPTYVICKNKDVVRTIRVERFSQACKTTYTKNGEDKIVGKSKTEDVCIEVLANIKKNLEESNWKCKDISASRVSSSI